MSGQMVLQSITNNQNDWGLQAAGFDGVATTSGILGHSGRVWRNGSPAPRNHMKFSSIRFGLRMAEHFGQTAR